MSSCPQCKAELETAVRSCPCCNKTFLSTSRQRRDLAMERVLSRARMARRKHSQARGRDWKEAAGGIILGFSMLYIVWAVAAGDFLPGARSGGTATLAGAVPGERREAGVAVSELIETIDEVQKRRRSTGGR